MWVDIEKSKPKENIYVSVLTENGALGTAMYWKLIGKWISCDPNLKSNDQVIKWKYCETDNPIP
jgi:hypothetical protein